MASRSSPTGGASRGRLKADFGCLVCRYRKIRCDRTLPLCQHCHRFGVRCPGYDEDTKSMTRLELKESAQDIFDAAGHDKRRFGSCKECRVTKARCCRSQPTCARCASRGLQCLYSHSKSAVPTADATQDASPEWTSNDWNFDPQYPSPTTLSNTSSSAVTRASLPLEELFSDDIPERDGIVDRLISAYFDRIHNLRVYSFVHKPSFLLSLQRETVDRDFGKPLLQIMCALGARVLYMDNYFSQPDQRPVTGKPDNAWAEAAHRAIMPTIHLPTIQTLMTSILLGEYALRTDQHALAFVLSGCTFRAVQLLGHSNPARLQEVTGTAWPEGLLQETWSRVVWASYTFDVFLASGVDLNSAWQNHIPKVSLPCSNRDFLGQISSAARNLDPDVTLQDTAIFGELDLPALMIILVRLRAAVLKLIRCSATDEKVPWDSSSSFLRIISQLDALGDSIPDRLQMTDLNIYVHRDEHTLVGFTFPLARAFNAAPPLFRLQCQRRANFHATEVSELTRKGLAYVPASFDDPFLPDAILESTKVQIIYDATVANNEANHGATKHNIRTNLQALSLLHSGSTRENPYIRFILPLCSAFNFKDICKEWRNTQGTADVAIEITGSADLEHLVSYAPFRKAVSQLHARQSAASNSPQDRSHDPTLYGGRKSTRPPIEASTINLLDQTFDGATSEPRSNIQPVGFSTDQQPTQLEIPRMPGTLMFSQDDPSVLPNDSQEGVRYTAEDYIRTADQLSEYITWDLSEMPFMPSGQQNTWMEGNFRNDNAFE